MEVVGLYSEEGVEILRQFCVNCGRATCAWCGGMGKTNVSPCHDWALAYGWRIKLHFSAIVVATRALFASVAAFGRGADLGNIMGSFPPQLCVSSWLSLLSRSPRCTSGDARALSFPLL